MASNPRWKSGKRRKYRARFKAMQAPCHICNGKLGAIRYDEPSDSKHPLSFVIDEIIPIKYWKQAGYNSPSAAADDPENIAPAHWICNARKGAKLNFDINKQGNVQPMPKTTSKGFLNSGKW